MDLSDCACSGKSLPKLLRPALLTCLVAEKTHGYELIRRLAEMKFFSDSRPDVSGVYKVLNAMENELLIHSVWMEGEEGPSRRRYSLTVKGQKCLRRWTATLENYSEQVNELLSVLRKS